MTSAASRQIVIDNTTVSDETDCYVIAEIGANHMGDVEICKEIIQAAKSCGASAIKMQKRNNKTLFTKAAYDAPYDNENSFGDSYGEHREFVEFGKEEFLELKRFCSEIGITMFSTAFDLESVDFLEEIELPAYKVASGDITHIPLIEKIARTGKPMILSTGGATMEDVERAHNAARKHNDNVAILQCTSGYPAVFEELDMNVITTFRKAFPETVIGLSSHDNGIAMATASYVLGSRIVEKHFTLNRAWKGADQAFSLEPGGLRRLVRDLGRLRIALGSSEKRVFDSEVKPLKKMRKGIVAKKALTSGHTIAEDDFCFKVPAEGIPPYDMDKVVGKKLTSDVSEDQPITFEILS